MLAFDPSVRGMGWAVVDGSGVEAANVVDLQKLAGLTGREPAPLRLGAVGCHAREIAATLLTAIGPVDAVVVEDPFRRGKSTTALLHVQGALLQAAFEAGATAMLVSLSTWRASMFPKRDFPQRDAAALKKAAVEMASEAVGRPVESDDAAEAACLGLYAARSMQRRPAPKRRRAA